VSAEQQLALAGLVVAVLALVVAVGAQARLTRVRRALRLLRGHAGEGDVLDLVARQTAELTEQRRQVEALRARLDETRADVASSLRHVAVVRYDVSGTGAGGRQSFSAALVDDSGDGLVVTSVGDSGTTAKGLTGGTSDLPLSDEEAQAVHAATRSTPTRGRR
jgi:hypothetical protein